MPPDKYFLSTELDLNRTSVLFTLKKVLPQERLGEFETRTDGYILTNLTMTYLINKFSINHKIIFEIDNIFDQTYYNHLSRLKLIMPEEGRNFRLQYRIFF